MLRNSHFWQLSCAIALSLLSLNPTVAVAQPAPVPALQEEITNIETQFGEDSPALAAKLLELGQVFHEANNYPEALTQYERALAILEQNPERDPELRLQVINALVQIHLDLFQSAEALRYLQQRQELEAELYPDDVARQLETLQRLAEGYSLVQQTDQAVQEYENLLELESERLGSQTHPDLVRRLHDLAIAYQRLSLFEEAQVLYDRVAQIFAEHPDAFSDLDRAILLNNQAMFSPREENFVQMYRQLRQMSQMLDQSGILTQDTKLPITFYVPFQKEAAPAVLLQYNWVHYHTSVPFLYLYPN
jgi:tetratricopeptide (TPR) repeat protein